MKNRSITIALFGTAVFFNIVILGLYKYLPPVVNIVISLPLLVLNLIAFIPFGFLIDLFYSSRHFRHILYNEEDKEVTIILGYGIGNHLSVAFLLSTLYDVVTLFPGLLFTKWWKIPFLEVADSSRSHRYEWYTRFKYDLSGFPRDRWGYYEITNTQTAYGISSHIKGVNDWQHEDETASQVVSRLVHS